MHQNQCIFVYKNTFTVPSHSHILITFTSPDVPAFTLSPVYISTLYKQSPIFGSSSIIFFFNRGFGATYSILGFADTGRFG